MLRIIAGIVVGLVITFALVAATFGMTIAISGGLEQVLQPGSWWTTNRVNIIILVGGTAAAILAGVACMLIARNFIAALWLAAILLAIRTGSLVMNLNKPDPPERTTAPTIEAMFDHGKEPAWFAVSMTAAGSVGVLIGASMIKRRGSNAAR